MSLFSSLNQQKRVFLSVNFLFVEFQSVRALYSAYCPTSIKKTVRGISFDQPLGSLAFLVYGIKILIAYKYVYRTTALHVPFFCIPQLWKTWGHIDLLLFIFCPFGPLPDKNLWVSFHDFSSHIRVIVLYVLKFLTVLWHLQIQEALSCTDATSLI